jgi:anti-sigma regulatory factor (Ser/Thr protein kinase)
MVDDQRSFARSVMTAQWAGRATGERVGAAGQDWLWSALEHADLLDRCPRDHSAALVADAVPATSETCALPPEPESVRIARDFAVTALRGWGLGALDDDVGLVVSELVTNALHHATPPDPKPGRCDPIQLTLIRREDEVICAVRDTGTEIPFRKEPHQIAETGRGLLLVESFSQAWGWTPLRDNGKVVWALFAANC